MKKLIAAILTSAMLMTPTMALAEPNGPQGMSPQRQQTRQEAPRGENQSRGGEQTQRDDSQSRGEQTQLAEHEPQREESQQVPGNSQQQAPSDNRQQAPSRSSQQAPTDNRQQAPADNQQQAPTDNRQQAPSGNQQQALMNNGEAPAQNPQMPDAAPSQDGQGGMNNQQPGDVDGQQPNGMDSQMPGNMNGQQPGGMDGQMPNNMNGQQPGGMNGQMPNGMEGQQPDGMNDQNPNGMDGHMPNNMNGQMPNGMDAPMGEPVRIDFDALVTEGVISQETRDSIETYMEGDKPAQGQLPERRSDGRRITLLDELLLSGVITAQEYETISATQTASETTPTESTQTPPEKPADDQQQNTQTPPKKPADDQQQDGQTPPEMPADGQQPNGMTPPAMPTDGQMPGAPGMADEAVTYTAASTVTEDGDGASYDSSADGENAVLVQGETVTLTHATVTKTGSSSAGNADFNGVNAAVLATDGATLTLEDANIATDGGHANGVFSTGSGTTVNVSNSTIRTTGNNSGGLMTTGGATLNATNLDVSTTGNSSAAIRSDRGGGTVNVAQGTYAASGVGSPAIYSTADITVSDATLSAANSEAVVIEGGNAVTLNNVDISGCNATLNGQSTQRTNVMIYQSMSGDASEGSSRFTMTGGSMTAGTGSMFHVTNVTTTIDLENVDFTYAEDSDVFLDASADAWGSAGKNGGNVTLNLKNQAITGAITCDSVSSVTVNLGENAAWTLTGDSFITALNGDLENVDLNGFTLYINGVAVGK